MRVADERLYHELSSLRFAIGRRRKIPPHRVASDEILHALAQARPRRLDDWPFVGWRGEAQTIVEAGAFLSVIENFGEIV